MSKRPKAGVLKPLGKEAPSMPTKYDDSTEVYFEDLEVGDEFKSMGRTITEADLVNFAALIGWYDPLHCDEEYAAKTMFGKRIASGVLGLALSNGLCRGCFPVKEGRALNMAFAGVEWQFKGPIYIGDTIHIEQEIIAKKETQKPDRGMITVDVSVVNQGGKVVQGGKKHFLIKRSPA